MVWAEPEGPWNAFRNGWSMLVTGDSNSSAEGVPVKKKISWMKTKIHFAGCIKNIDAGVKTKV